MILIYKLLQKQHNTHIIVWIERTLEGNQEGAAAGLLEECVLDDDQGKCERFDTALKKLDSLLGVGASEQY